MIFSNNSSPLDNLQPDDNHSDDKFFQYDSNTVEKIREIELQKAIRRKQDQFGISPFTQPVTVENVDYSSSAFLSEESNHVHPLLGKSQQFSGDSPSTTPLLNYMSPAQQEKHELQLKKSYEKTLAAVARATHSASSKPSPF